MKLGFNGATTMTSSFETDVRIASQAGFDVLEITAAKLDAYLKKHSIQDARKLVDTAKIKTHTINSITRINTRNAAERRDALARTREISEWCRVLDCPWIIVVPGATPPGAAWNEIRDETIAALRAMNDIAAPLGVKLAFEFLGFPWCSVQTVAQAHEIVTAIDLPTIGMAIDTCHIFAGGSTIASIKSIDAKKLAVLHINDVEKMPREHIEDANRLFPGDGVIPLKEIVAAVRATGFNGIASVEIFRPAYWKRAPLSVAKEAFRKSKQALKK